MVLAGARAMSVGDPSKSQKGRSVAFLKKYLKNNDSGLLTLSYPTASSARSGIHFALAPTTSFCP